MGAKILPLSLRSGINKDLRIEVGVERLWVLLSQGEKKSNIDSSTVGPEMGRPLILDFDIEIDDVRWVVQSRRRISPRVFLAGGRNPKALIGKKIAAKARNNFVIICREKFGLIKITIMA